MNIPGSTSLLDLTRNLKTFLEWVQRGEVVAYGKRLTLCHALAQFDPQSQALIQLLMNEFQSFRTLDWEDQARYNSYDSKEIKGSLYLTGDSFDCFFQMYFRQTLMDSYQKRR